MGKLKNKIKTKYKRWYRATIVRLMANRSFLIDLYYSKFWKPKNGTEAILDTYSRLHPGLSCIQIGANDGYTHDPIAKFIYRDKWKAILVEPQKAPFENSLQVLYADNHDVHPVNAAIGHEMGKATLYVVAFSQERWATGLASFNKQVVLDHFVSGYANRGAIKEGIEVPTDPHLLVKPQEVACVTFPYLMETYGFQKIDLLQIDAEGFDFEVIKMLDFDSIHPVLISFESVNLSDSERTACFQLLQSKGYRLYTESRDTIALKEEEALKSEYAAWFSL